MGKTMLFALKEKLLMLSVINFLFAEKYQVIRVYAEKPKPTEPSKEEIFIEKPSKDSENFRNIYRRKSDSKNVRGDESQRNIRQDENSKEIRGTGSAKNNMENIFENTELPLSDEITLRNMIRNRIKEKMGTKDSYIFNDENGKEKHSNEIKRSDNANDIDIIDETNSAENEIDLEDKINQIETQMDKLKKNTGGHRSTKVDRVFENIFKIVKKCHNDSAGLPLYDCLKDHLLKSVESLMFTSNKTLPIVNDLLYLENNLSSDKRDAVVAENRGLNFNQKIMNALNMWLNHLSIKVKLPTDFMMAESEYLPNSYYGMTFFTTLPRLY